MPRKSAKPPADDPLAEADLAEADAAAGAREPALNQGIERTSLMLHALRRGDPAGMRLTDLVAATGLSKSTTHRLLGGLSAYGLVEQDPDTGLFHLGVDLFLLGHAAARRYGLVDTARESLTKLAGRTQDSVFLSVRSGHDAVCVDRREGSFPIKVLTLTVGYRRPLGIGAGSLALLAALPDDDVAAVIAGSAEALRGFAPYTPSMLRELVAVTRRQGYALNEGLLIPEMCAVGVPVRAADGRPVAALSSAAITSRMQPERRATVVRWLTDEAKALEARLAKMGAALAPTPV